MPVMDTLIVRGRSVLRMFGSAETSGAGVPDGTVRLYNDGTHSYLQVYSLATGAWTTLTPEAALVIENLTTAGASGTVPTSDGAGGLTMEEASGPTIIVKAADETVNNSATLQDDDDFAFAVGASETWIVEIHARGSLHSGGDIKFAFTVPSGAAMTGTAWGAENDPIVSGASADLTSALALTSNDTLTQLHVYATFVNSTTAGTVQFQWAQNSAALVDSTISAGSYLIAWKVS